MEKVREEEERLSTDRRLLEQGLGELEQGQQALLQQQETLQEVCECVRAREARQVLWGSFKGLFKGSFKPMSEGRR